MASAQIRGTSSRHGNLYVNERSTGTRIGKVDFYEGETWAIDFDPAAFPGVKSADDIRVSRYIIGTCNPNGGFGYDGTVSVVFQ